MNFTNIMNSSQYDFLRTHPRLGNKIILLGLGGSYAYGTNNENSDIDFMIVLNRAVGMEFFGLYYFLQEEFGKNVDVISEKEAYEIMPKSIERDKVKVYGNE